MTLLFASSVIKLATVEYLLTILAIFIKLQFKKIKAIIRIKTGGAIIELEGIPTRFKTLYTPSNSIQYGGVLVDKMGYILYGLYLEKQKDTVRKI